MYKASEDYPRLKELLDSGEIIVCFIDYDFGIKSTIRCRDIAKAKKISKGENTEYGIYARGVGYCSVYPFWNDKFTDECLYNHWKRANVQFIDPDGRRNTVTLRTE